ncbi:hypothetical protein PAECIP111890_04483 [Paenibacillus sp. JJ-223]|nr:hypothetical protein PAECIP111890_04483 [Paenibacillus sp. JJ-223]
MIFLPAIGLAHTETAFAATHGRFFIFTHFVYKSETFGETIDIIL